ncbi:G-protein coupled receptor Mth2 [Lucilia cuprina]|nr:G-protein coupled receptor Mth2 [Lucilia cuprina]
MYKSEMYFKLLLTLLLGQLFIKVPLALAIKEYNHTGPCPYKNTVNLKHYHRFENGTYRYRDLMIPPEKQYYYDYHLNFQKTKKSVQRHIRGCVCEKRPCVKLCCEDWEYFDFSQNMGKCKKLSQDMKVSWDVAIQRESAKIEKVNIFQHFTPQVDLPCREPEELDSMLDKWMLFENGTLFVAYDNSYYDTLQYCYSPLLNTTTMEYILTPYTCPVKNIPSWKQRVISYAMAISVLFLIPTIVVYISLKELRGNLRGKLLICYILSLAIGYIIIALINISELQFDIYSCNILGYTCYFFLVAAFLWLNVLCFDIWKNFKETSYLELNSKKSVKEFIFYSLYVWLGAGFATGVCIFIQLSRSVNELYKPGIGNQKCWLDTQSWSAAIYFYGPTLVILLFNLVTFIHLTARICKIRSDIANMTHREKFIEENAIVIFRLYLIMGISWLFDVISYCLPDTEKWMIAFAISDFLNAIQGILIFSLFVLKANVLDLLRKRFCKNHKTQTRRSISTSTTILSKSQNSCSRQATHYENGSYLYEGILIPPERQHFYNFEITGSFPLKVAVPIHMRACVCDMKPCLKLCCEKDEFLSDMGKCEKMTPDMRVSWKLPILLDNGQIKHINILEHFTPQVGVICEEHVALVKDTNLWSLRENGIINVSQMPPIPTYGYCLTPHLSGETSKTVLSPYACRLLPTWRKLLNLYASLISVTLLTPTILIYALIKELRDTLSGKLLICYLVSLATMIGLVAFIKVSFINFNRTQCHILGCRYLSFLSPIMADYYVFIFWKNFNKVNVETNVKKDMKQFIRYSLYVWPITVVATAVCIFVELSSSVDATYKPGFGEIVCWLQLAFIRFLTIFYKTRRDAARLRRNQKIFKENILIIVRLLLVLGIPRFFIIISYFIPKGSSGDLFTTIADLINVVQVDPDKCPYEKTVNLTNHKKFDNGSYLYEGILIPPEKQDIYDYRLDFMRKKITVPRHLRGCVCSENQPCIKLCCEKEEYLNIDECEKVTREMKVQWKLTIQRTNYKNETVDVFKHFKTQAGLPCRWPIALEKDLDEWILKENGNLYILFDETEIALNYCYSLLQLEEDSTEYALTPFVCFAPNILSWKIYLSFFVYLVLKELRQHMSGQLMICYVLSQIISNAIISFINISNLSFGFLSCFIMGYTAYFFYLSLYLWLSVLCYDISKSFNNINAELNLRKNRKKFIIYSLYVWLSAGLATAIGILLELLPNVDEAYKTGIGLEMCYINLIFIRLIAMIYKTRRDAARLVRNRNIYKQNALVILRLSLILGIPWIFEILSVWNRIEFLFVIADFIIAIQGFLTFVLFVMRPKVWFLIKNSMDLLIHLKLLTWLINIILPLTTAQMDPCPFEHTVNLTNHQRFNNGSYLYEDILIPLEKQGLYGSDTVHLHERGCVCEEKPCMEWCCEKDEFLSVMNTCEKFTQPIKVRHILPILLKTNEIKYMNVFKHFTTRVNMPCDNPVSIDRENRFWILQENGLLNLKYSDVISAYCFSPVLNQDTLKNVLSPFACRVSFTWRKYLSMIKLRKPLGGKLFICYLLSFSTMCALLVFINAGNFLDPVPCYVLGYAGYFFYLSSILWLSILCLDIWKNFNTITVEWDLKKNLKQFLIYSLYVWLTAALATGMCIYMDLLENVDDIYKSGVVNKKSSWLYLFGPCLLIVLFNLATFIRLIINIYRTRRNAGRLKQNKKVLKENALITLRLMLIMGIPWILTIISYFIPAGTTGDLISSIAEFVHIIQGILVFICFVLRPKVWYLLKMRFRRADTLETLIF